MRVRRLATGGVEVLFVSAAVLLLLGQVLGQPVLLGYVETGSMAPTLEEGDGFVAVPAALAGLIEIGDVVTYRAKRFGSGGLTTHRVVAATDTGYVTRGDANLFTDQESATREPMIQRPQIAAVALTVRGEVVAIPYLGAAVETMRSAVGGLERSLVAVVGPTVGGRTGLSILLALAGIGLYAVSVVRERRQEAAAESEPARPLREALDGLPPMRVVALLAVLLVVSTTASMVLPGGVHEVGIVSAENDAPGPRVIEQGTSETTTYAVANGGVLPVVAYVESDGDAVAVGQSELTVPGRERVDTTLTLHAPEDIGYYRYHVVERRYLAVLPLPVIRQLYRLHPWAPIVAIDALLGLGVLLLGRFTVTPRPSDGWRPLQAMFDRLRRDSTATERPNGCDERDD